MQLLIILSITYIYTHVYTHVFIFLIIYNLFCYQSRKHGRVQRSTFVLPTGYDGKGQYWDILCTNTAMGANAKSRKTLQYTVYL